MYAEMITQILVYPLSWFLSPIFMGMWVQYYLTTQLIHSVSSFGKNFLLMNYCAIQTSFFVCLFGILDLIEGFTRDTIDTSLTLLNLVKIALFANLNLFAYLGCLFLNHNDDIEE
jgi:hypothetical protein